MWFVVLCLIWADLCFANDVHGLQGTREALDSARRVHRAMTATYSSADDRFFSDTLHSERGAARGTATGMEMELSPTNIRLAPIFNPTQEGLSRMPQAVSVGGAPRSSESSPIAVLFGSIHNSQAQHYSLFSQTPHDSGVESEEGQEDKNQEHAIGGRTQYTDTQPQL
jgi:hypothetical protein